MLIMVYFWINCGEWQWSAQCFILIPTPDQPGNTIEVSCRCLEAVGFWKEKNRFKLKPSKTEWLWSLVLSFQNNCWSWKRLHCSIQNWWTALESSWILCSFSSFSWQLWPGKSLQRHDCQRGTTGLRGTLHGHSCNAVESYSWSDCSGMNHDEQVF